MDAITSNDPLGRVTQNGKTYFQHGGKLFLDLTDQLAVRENDNVDISTWKEEWGYQDFTLPDYKAKGLNLYYNFNTAFSNRFQVSEQYLLDPDMVPPEHFQWFFQTGGDNSNNVIQASSLTVEHPDGTTEFYDFRTPEFDPTDPMKGNTWAAYRDSSGVTHRVSADIMFNYNETDLSLASLFLNFSGTGTAQENAANQFLSNLQVYPKWYFYQPMLANPGFDLKA